MDGLSVGELMVVMDAEDKGGMTRVRRNPSESKASHSTVPWYEMTLHISNNPSANVCTTW